MTGLVTNVLVRCIMQDDRRQSPKATQLIEGLSNERPGFVPLVVVLELMCVLSSSDGLKRDDIAEASDLLLRSKGFVVDRADLVLQAQRRFAPGGADFADCPIERIAYAQGCDTTMTFDVFAARASGMSLLA